MPHVTGCECHPGLPGALSSEARWLWVAQPQGAPVSSPLKRRLTVPSELQLLRRMLDLMGTVLGSSHMVKMLFWPGTCTSSIHLPLSWEDRVQFMGL